MPYMKKRGKKMQLNMTGIYTKLYAITDHTPCDVDTLKRLGAYIVDWVVGGIFTGLPAVLLYSGLTKKQDMFGGLYVFESLGYARGWAFLAGALCILFALFYFVYVPWRIWPGQTLGKHIAGYRIEKTDGTAVDLLTLLKRQVIGGFLLEGAAFVASNYIRQLVTLSLSYYVDYYWQIAGMILTALSLILGLCRKEQLTVLLSDNKGLDNKGMGNCRRHGLRIQREKKAGTCK